MNKYLSRMVEKRVTMNYFQHMVSVYHLWKTKIPEFSSVLVGSIFMADSQVTIFSGAGENKWDKSN